MGHAPARGLPGFERRAGGRGAHGGVQRFAPLGELLFDALRPFLEYAARPVAIALEIPGQFLGLDRTERRREAVSLARNLRRRIGRVVRQRGERAGVTLPAGFLDRGVSQLQDQVRDRGGLPFRGRLPVVRKLHAQCGQQLGQRVADTVRITANLDHGRLFLKPEP